MDSSYYADLIGGILLIVAGIAISVIAINNYPLGTIQRMGPGMFPTGLGVILILLGITLALFSRKQKKVPLDVRFASPLFVLGSIAAFAMLIVPFGLVPAINGALLVALLAERRLRIVDLLLLGTGLSLLAPFVFRYCLNLPIPLMNWPF